MLGVISNKASLSLVTRTLRVLEETLGRHEDEVYLLESITICLTAFLPLLEEVSGNNLCNRLIAHLQTKHSLPIKTGVLRTLFNPQLVIMLPL